MVKTIRVSEEFHELVAAHKRSGETMEEALRRMVSPLRLCAPTSSWNSSETRMVFTM